MGRYDEAVPAYKKALELDPTNIQSKKALELAEKKALESGQRVDSSALPDIANINSLSSLLSNPALRNLASQIGQSLGGDAASTPPSTLPPVASPSTASENPMEGIANSLGQMPEGITNFMNDPNMMKMAESVMNQPGFGQMMQNPAIMQLAQQMMQDPSSLSSLLGSLSPNKPQ